MRRRRRLAAGIGALLLMAVLLVVYAALHTPTRKPLWDSLFGGCNLFCRELRVAGPVFDGTAALWLLGSVLIGAIPLAGRVARSGLERIVAWGLIAYALLVIPAAIIGFLGDRVGIRLLEPPLGPLLASAPALLAIGWSFARGWRPSWPRGEPTVPFTPAIIVLVGLVVASIVISVGIAARYPLTGFDDLGYHAPLATLLWREGSIESFLPTFAGTPVLNHPGGAELFQGLLLLIGGEPLAVMGQLPFALLGAAGVALFGRRLGLWTGAGVLAALFFLLAPMITEQLGHLRNDVIAASLVIAVTAILTGRDGTTLPVRLTLGALGLGLMLVTKLSLLPAVGGLGLLIAWIVWQEHKAGRPMDRVWRGLGLGVGLALLAVAPWWIRNAMLHTNPLYPLDLPLIGGGVAWTSPPDSFYVPDRLLWPLYPLLERYGPADGLGGAFAVGIVPGIVAALFLARRRPLAALGLLVLVSLPAWALLDRREPRFLLGIAGLAFALIPFVLVALRRPWRHLAVALLVLAAGVTVGGHWLALSPDGVVERTAYYDKEWGVDPVADALPETNGILLDDRCGENASRLYPWFGAGRQRRVARIDCEGATTERIRKVMKRERLDHVLVFVPPDQRDARLALYPADEFQIVSESTFTNEADVTWDRIVLTAQHELPGRPSGSPEPDGSPAPGSSPAPASSAAPEASVAPVASTAPGASSAP